MEMQLKSICLEVQKDVNCKKWKRVVVLCARNAMTLKFVILNNLLRGVKREFSLSKNDQIFNPKVTNTLS